MSNVEANQRGGRRRSLARLGATLLAAGLGLVVVLWAGWRLSRSPTYQLLGEIHARVDTARPAVAITFDDGPSPANTPAILEVLRRHGAKATFFVIGREVVAHPDIAKAVVAAGHELGNHSYTHERMVFVSPGFARREIEQTDAVLRGVGYAGELLFRPPYTKKLLVLPWVLRTLAKKSIAFDAQAHDTETQDPEVLTRNVLRWMRAGSIVLFHDGGAPKPGTVDALDRVLAEAERRGLTPVTVSELLRAGT